VAATKRRFVAVLVGVRSSGSAGWMKGLLFMSGGWRANRSLSSFSFSFFLRN
jgi:hypothetical protein